jgi:hypothetical protein
MDTTDHSGDFGLIHELQFDSRSIAGAVVIQEIPSRLYLSEEDFLTLDIADARKFDSCSAALEETTHLKLKSVQLVMNGESREWEILPVGTTIIL